MALDRTLQKLSDFLYRIFYVFITVTFAFLLIILFINVIARNLLGSSIASIEEGSRFVFTWMMFFGIAVGIFKKKHLGVEFLVSRYSPGMKHFFEIVSCLLTLVLFLTLTVYGFIYAKSTMTMRSPIMGPVARLIARIAREQGKTAHCQLFVQREAWDALTSGHPEEHNRILLKNIRELDSRGFDAIVMSQVSMRALLPDLKDVRTPVLCSFYSGYGAAADKLNAIRAAG